MDSTQKSKYKWLLIESLPKWPVVWNTELPRELRTFCVRFGSWNNIDNSLESTFSGLKRQSKDQWDDELTDVEK
jgi:hypothetical protein